MKEVELEGYNNYAYATDQQAQQRTLQHRQEAPRPQQLPPPLQLHRLHQYAPLTQPRTSTTSSRAASPPSATSSSSLPSSPA